MRDDENLSSMRENGTVKSADYENVNDLLYYYFNKFDIIEAFVLINDEDPCEVYTANYMYLYDFLMEKVI